MSNHSKMKGYISILLLISAALTFDGTEAGCRNRCRNICEQPEKTSGQNCCRGNSGTYLDGSYDYACKNGRCYLGRYMPSLRCIREPVKKSVENSTLGGGGLDRIIFHT